MTSENINTPNVSLQAVLLTMIIEKIDNLANRVADIQLHSSASQKSFDTLQTRIAALEEKSDKILLQQSNAIFGQNNIAKHKDGSGYSVQDAYYEPVVKIDVVTHVESEQR
uniref:Uncharacterized protein n=1 Tax=Panagrolaimus superbus TaxID=310955 RepID=A0A914YSK4_9BILA